MRCRLVLVSVQLDALVGQPGGFHEVDGDETVDADSTSGAEGTRARLPWTPCPNKVRGQ